VVGRAPDAHVRLRDTFVSSHHARFTAEAGGLRVEDLGSTNGTFVEGRELEPEVGVLLGAGGRVSVGDTVFLVEPR
jgi:pSer/pThr/pTyr-binding forkhead associated (FHA) protein